MSSDNPAAAVIVKLLEDNRHFADLSSQIHFGDEVLPERAVFHNDGPNSAMHVALSINGRRSLFWKGSKDPAFLDDVHSAAPSGYEIHEAPQVAGSVYLSSPFIVSHGVGYPRASWDNRVIAVQCRCLFTRGEFSDMYSASEHDWQATMQTVSACLGRTQAAMKHTTEDKNRSVATYVFRFPSLSEVQVVYEELLPQWKKHYYQNNHDHNEETATTTAAATPAAVSLVQFMKTNPPQNPTHSKNEGGEKEE